MTYATDRKPVSTASEPAYLMADSLPHLVWVTAADGGVEFLNRYCLEYTGQPMSEMLGWDWDRVIHSDDLPATIREWNRCLQTGSEFSVEYRLRRHDGVYRWHLGRAQPFRDSDGTIRRWFGTCTDVDDRKQVEESLGALNVALENAVEGIARLDVEGRYLSVNPAYARITGFTPREMIGMPWQSTVHPDDRPMVLEACRRMRSTGRAEAEVRGLRKDGTAFYKHVVMVQADGIGDQPVGHYCFMRDISDKRAADEALRASETRFRALVEYSYDAVQLLSAEGTILYSTPAIVLTGGRTPEEVIGHQAFEWTHPDDLPDIANQFGTFLSEPGASRRVESRYQHKNGAWRWVEATCTNLLHEPAVGAVVVNVHDITDRKQAEEALRASNDLLQAVANGTTDAVFVKDRTGRYLFSNAVTAEYLNKPIDELIDLCDIDLVPPEFAARFRMDDLAVMGGGVARTYEETVPSADGRRVLLTSKAPYRDADGNIVGVIGISRDITDRKRAEEEREKFVALVENAADFISVATLDGEVLYVNPAGRQLVGLDDSLPNVAPRIEDFTTPEVAALWREVAIPQALSGGRWEGEVQLRHMQTGRLLDIQQGIFVIKTRDNGVPLCLATVARDVTERKRLEEQLRHAQKMEAVGRLAAGVAHDFNNLLTVINGYSEMVLAAVHEHSPIRSMFEEVHKAGERAAGLTRQLLAFSRQQILQPKVLDLNEVLTELCKMLRRLIGEDVQLVLKSGSGLLPVEADPGQIEQVLMNLAVNARDAMPTGGRLTIETRNETLDRRTARDGTEIPAGVYVVISVSDTGCGMPDEVLAHIFEPFFTTKEQGKGTGLGLPTVYGIVRQSGGHIEVETVVDQGTTFRLYLPAVGTASAVAKNSPSTPPMPRGSETILVVEDEDGVRGLTKLMLQQLGYNVLAAAGAQQAAAICRETGHAVNLTLTDVVMPGESGRTLAERLQVENPRMCVLYMSGYTDDSVVRHGIEHDHVAFIQKPFSASVLAHKIRAVLDAGSATGELPATT